MRLRENRGSKYSSSASASIFELPASLSRTTCPGTLAPVKLEKSAGGSARKISYRQFWSSVRDKNKKSDICIASYMFTVYTVEMTIYRHGRYLYERESWLHGFYM